MKNSNYLKFNIMQYIIAIFTILECNSIYSQIYNAHHMIRTIFILIVIVCMVASLFIFFRPIKIYKKAMKFIIYDYLCSILMLINTSSVSGKAIIILVFMIYLPVLLIYLTNLTKFQLYNLLKNFVNIVVILCVISLVFWGLSSVIGLLKPTNALKVVWAKPYSLIDSYFFLHFDTQDVWWITGSSLMRNTGIFTEGPMYALIIIVALIFNNLLLPIEKGKSYKKNIIMFITMISTISVTGIFCSFIILFGNIKTGISMMRMANKKQWIYILIIICIILIPFTINLMIKKISTSSAVHRNLDIQIGMKKFVENPIIGKGINHERETELDYETGYGYSNTIIPVLTDGGILLANIYLIPAFLLGYKSLKKRKKKILAMLIVYFIILFTTLVQYRLIMLLFISLIYVLNINNEFFEEEIKYE